MIDPKRLREKSCVQTSLRRRGVSEQVLESFLEADQAWRDLVQEMDALKAQRNQLTPKGKPSEMQRDQLKALSQSIKEKQETLLHLENAQKKAASLIPNILAEDVPEGSSEVDNVVLACHGDLPRFSFKPLSHDELGTRLGILDFETASKIAGSRFVLNIGQGAALERALSQFMLDLHTKEHGYLEIIPPAIVQDASLYGTGQLPKFSEDCFKLEETSFWLSPTAEVQLTNMYRNLILKASDLPKKVTAHTLCFRKEAGSYGKDVKGLIRQHQFNKVELVQLVSPDDSDKALEALCNHAQRVLEKLELPYRVVSLCGADIGFSAAKTIDLEVWFPSQGSYREISSCSNFLDFQSRRAMIRCRNENGDLEYPHTLNGSGLAVGRTLAAVLENYQQEDGSVLIPKALQPYLGLEKIECETGVLFD